MSLTIYHNPRCSKSRKTLELIESRGIQPTIVEYLSSPPDAATLLDIAGRLGVPLTDLLRRGETEFKEAGESVPLDDENQLANWIASHPKVLQRPVVVDSDSGKAIVGRPPENVFELIGQ